MGLFKWTRPPAPDPWLFFDWHESVMDSDDGERLDGRGFMLRDAEGVAFEWEAPNLREDDVYVVRVAGVSHRRDTLRLDSFDPGRTIALVRDPKNEHDRYAIGIWDRRRQVQVGWVPADINEEIGELLTVIPETTAVSLWEWRKPGTRERCALRALIAPTETLAAFPFTS